MTPLGDMGLADDAPSGAPPDNVRRRRRRPPPPHDPTERVLALVVDDWEVRLYEGRKFEYFSTRGLLHLQLWHPGSGVSVLTPSRLTNGLFEVFPIDDWKARVSSYESLAPLVRSAGATPLAAGRIACLESALVRQFERAARAGAASS